MTSDKFTPESLARLLGQSSHVLLMYPVNVPALKWWRDFQSRFQTTFFMSAGNESGQLPIPFCSSALK